MSFSSEIKEELSAFNNWNQTEQLKAELNGYYMSSNTIIDGNIISYVTENDSNLKRYQKILKNLGISFETIRKGKIFQTQYHNDEKIDLTNINIEEIDILKAVLRGAFMATGTINNPNSKYHLEIFLSSKENAKFIIYITEQFNIYSKLLKRKKNYVVYLKDGEAISNFLALIGANKAVLNFEEVRVMREMKNKVNRIVNCETANLNKIINVSVLQIDDIKYLIKNKHFDELPNNLQEIARIRMENPDMSLEQMGKLLEKPIGKSGVNHRLKKIREIAEELRKEDRA